MSLPDVSVAVQDGALGILPSSSSNACVTMGICSGGVVGTLYSFSDQTTLQATLGQGPLVEAVALKLAVAGGPQFALPVNPSVAGSKSSVTQVGTGSGTVSVSYAPAAAIVIKCTTSGQLATAQFTYAIGGGAASAPVISASGWSTSGWNPGTAGWLIPGTLTALQFQAATNYTAGDTWTIGTDGTITAGSNTGPGTISAQVSQPLDTYQAVLAIASGGALGTATFTYSLDNGNTTSGAITIPSGAGKYQLTGTGVVLTFASTFAAGDTYSFNTFAVGYTTTDLTNAFTALFTYTTQWGFVHVVGTAASASGAAAVAAIVDAQMTLAAVNFRWAFGFVECPTLGTILASGAVDTSDTDTAVISAFASFVSVRTAVAAGDADVVSTLTGRIARRNAAWPAAARCAAVIPSESIGYVGRGALAFVRKLYRDEFVTQALDAARFVTLRTFIGVPGFYVTRAPTMALATSDYNLIERRRVMDVACSIARQALLPYVNGTVRVDSKTGYIYEQDASLIETAVSAKVKAAVVNTSPPNASDAQVVLSRTSNLLSTSTEPVQVRVTPLAELQAMQLGIGYRNPALPSS